MLDEVRNFEECGGAYGGMTLEEKIRQFEQDLNCEITDEEQFFKILAAVPKEQLDEKLAKMEWRLLSTEQLDKFDAAFRHQLSPEHLHWLEA